MAEKDTGWKDFHTATLDGISVVASKAYVNHKAEYTVRFGVVKSDKSGSYFSPNVPYETVDLSVFAELHATAGRMIASDKAKDDQAEVDRIKALSAKPGTMINVRPPTMKTAGPAAPRVPNGPRATGKTAKKKAKLQARADEARAAASK